MAQYQSLPREKYVMYLGDIFTYIHKHPIFRIIFDPKILISVTRFFYCIGNNYTVVWFRQYPPMLVIVGEDTCNWVYFLMQYMRQMLSLKDTIRFLWYLLSGCQSFETLGARTYHIHCLLVHNVWCWKMEMNQTDHSFTNW